MTTNRRKDPAMPLPPSLRLAAIAMLLSWWSLPAPALADERSHTCTGFVTSLPAVIGTPGVWCFDRDLSTAMASGSAITIAAHRVTIDCNGFKLGGLAAGPASMAIGILSDNRDFATVRNCGIRGFHQGIHLAAGFYGLIEDNRLDGNLAYAINHSTQGGLVRRNRVLATGRPEFASATAIWLGGADAVDNIVSGIEGQTVYGIQSAGGSAIGNTVTGLAPSGGSAYGITCGSTAISTLFQHNRILAATTTPGAAISCTSANNDAIVCRENALVRFATAQVGCDATFHNLVRP